MLTNTNKSYQKMNSKEKKQQIKMKLKELALLQRQLHDQNIPALFLFEGWGASGKGHVMGKLIAELDARDYQVFSSTQDHKDTRHSFLYPYFKEIPQYGKMSLFDRSWYHAVFQLIEDEKDCKDVIQSIKQAERQLVDDGYLLFKFFLNIDKKEQEKRFKELDSEDSTKWRVTKQDWKNHENYEKRKEIFSEVLTQTNFDYAPWHVIDNEDLNAGVLEVLDITLQQVKDALAHGVTPSNDGQVLAVEYQKTPLVSELDLSLKLDDDQYKIELKEIKKELQRLHGLLYHKKIPVVLAFEGWDAAGKGGAIRRLSWALDPRGFDVIPVAAPTKEEINHHYLWRFYNALPKDGHISIFDRTWYGRVMVERIEKFTPMIRCNQAYNEINEFENDLVNWGAIVLKFWINVDKDEQLARFKLRQETPEKQYKITDEDWRNREKWDEYEVAIDEMIQKTSTKHAPWIIVEGNDKKYARIKVLKTVAKAMKDRLEQE